MNFVLLKYSRIDFLMFSKESFTDRARVCGDLFLLSVAMNKRDCLRGYGEWLQSLRRGDYFGRFVRKKGLWKGCDLIRLQCFI